MIDDTDVLLNAVITILTVEGWGKSFMLLTSCGQGKVQSQVPRPVYRWEGPEGCVSMAEECARCLDDQWRWCAVSSAAAGVVLLSTGFFLVRWELEGVAPFLSPASSFAISALQHKILHMRWWRHSTLKISSIGWEESGWGREQLGRVGKTPGGYSRFGVKFASFRKGGRAPYPRPFHTACLLV